MPDPSPRAQRRLTYAAAVYATLALLGGVFYRELTRSRGFTGETQLSVLHTHLFALGMFACLTFLVLERLFALSQHHFYRAFEVLWHVGVGWTTTMMVVNGTRTALGHERTAALAGISGVGHILLTGAVIAFFWCLVTRVRETTADTAPTVSEQSQP